MEIIKLRRSIREYSDKEIFDEAVNNLIKSFVNNDYRLAEQYARRFCP